MVWESALRLASLIPPCVNDVLEPRRLLRSPVLASWLGLLDGPVQPLPSLSDKPVKRPAVLTFRALLELRVDVHRHVRVGVGDRGCPARRGTSRRRSCE